MIHHTNTNGDAILTINGRIAHSIAETEDVSGICKTKIYEDINAGRLRVRKMGRRTVVLTEDLLAWLRGDATENKAA